MEKKWRPTPVRLLAEASGVLRSSFGLARIPKSVVSNARARSVPEARKLADACASAVGIFFPFASLTSPRRSSSGAAVRPSVRSSPFAARGHYHSRRLRGPPRRTPGQGRQALQGRSGINPPLSCCSTNCGCTKMVRTKMVQGGSLVREGSAPRNGARM